MSTDTPKRIWKGVWIPKEIWLHTKLTWLERCMVAEIGDLSSKETPCTASNAFLADRFGTSEKRIANILSDLRKKGFIETVSFDGRMRGLRVKADLPESGNPNPGIREPCIPESGKAPYTTENSLENSKNPPTPRRGNKASEFKGTDRARCLVNAMKQFSFYKVTKPEAVVKELVAAEQMLAAGETIEGVTTMARLSQNEKFNAYRCHGSKLVLIQEHMPEITTRLNGAIHVGFESREIQEHLTLPRIQL